MDVNTRGPLNDDPTIGYCWSWNRGRCQYQSLRGYRCRYLHVCHMCKSASHKACECTLPMSQIRYCEAYNQYSQEDWDRALQGSATDREKAKTKGGCPYTAGGCPMVHVCSGCLIPGHPLSGCGRPGEASTGKEPGRTFAPTSTSPSEDLPSAQQQATIASTHESRSSSVASAKRDVRESSLVGVDSPLRTPTLLNVHAQEVTQDASLTKPWEDDVLGDICRKWNVSARRWTSSFNNI